MTTKRRTRQGNVQVGDSTEGRKKKMWNRKSPGGEYDEEDEEDELASSAFEHPTKMSKVAGPGKGKGRSAKNKGKGVAN